MVNTDPSRMERAMSRPNLLPIFRWITVLLALLILIQAVLAGRGWFKDFDLIETHGIVGNITFLAAVATAGLAFMVGIPGRLGRQLLALSVIIALLTIMQIGLGYSTRDSAEAAVWHIPLGVLLFGLVTALMALVLQLRASDRAT